MAILINDIETEQYAIDVANRHGRLSKSAAMRLIAEEHRQFSNDRDGKSSPSSASKTPTTKDTGRKAAAAS